jgi:hypothetical protein
MKARVEDVSNIDQIDPRVVGVEEEAGKADMERVDPS